jgi:DNA modification methylase
LGAGAYRDQCRKCGAVRVDQQIGLEGTLAEYIDTLVAVFREVRRVLRPDGVCFLNLGDSYAGGGGFYPDAPSNQNGSMQAAGNRSGQRNIKGQRSGHGLKAKDLMMVPARVAIALQDDGWYLRSDIIWAKPNPMPESCRDHPTSAHEHIFLLTKSPRYYFDQEAVRTPATSAITKMPDGWDTGPGSHGTFHRNGREQGKRTDKQRGHGRRHDGFNDRWDAMPKDEQQANGANIRNVWTIATHPFPDAHFATFPTEIPRRCIKAGTSEKGACAACGAPWVRVVEREGTGRGLTLSELQDGIHERSSAKSLAEKRQAYRQLGSEGPPVATTTGWRPSCSCDADMVPQTVLDPFLGSGTTLLVADRLGRNGIGVELSPEYARMAKARIYNDAPLFADIAAD